jgi:hypothetical protein
VTHYAQLDAENLHLLLDRRCARHHHVQRSRDPTPSEDAIAVAGENPKPLGKLVEATIADRIAELRINLLRASCDHGYYEVVPIIFERPHECALRRLLRRKTGDGIGDRMSHRLCIDDRPSGSIFFFDELVTQPGGNNPLSMCPGQWSRFSLGFRERIFETLYRRRTRQEEGSPESVCVLKPW